MPSPERVPADSTGAAGCHLMAFALLMRVVLATMFATLRIAPHGKPAGQLTLRSFFFAPKGGTRVVLEGRREAAAL